MKIGLAILAAQRPQYLEKLLDSLAKNDLSQTDTTLFLDGCISRIDKSTEYPAEPRNKNLELFRAAKLGVKNEYLFQYNMGIAVAKQILFGHMSTHYDAFIYMEEDVVVSPSFVAAMRNALIQFEGDKQYASVSAGLRLLCHDDEVQGMQNKLKVSHGHIWAEAFWSDRWRDSLSPIYDQYSECIKDVRYRHKEHRRKEVKALYEKLGYSSSVISSDSAMDAAMHYAKMHRLRYIVNRATGIGDYGFHNTPEKLERSGDGHQPVRQFKENLKLEII